MGSDEQHSPRGRRGCLGWLAIVWLLLLAASHLVRWLHPWRPPSDPEVRTVEVAPVVGTEVRTGAVRLAYREWRPAGDASAPVLLLLHGSPGSSRDFLHLGPELAARFRVIAPDLPGFGASGRDVPDYSIRAHAAYCRELLDRLGVPAVHVLGYSMGGGVAIELAGESPGRVRSLILLSGLGTQELELLGNYGANHAVHALQLAGLWLLQELVPHFGLFDGGMLSVAYARNFFDTDQRPLRQLLLQLPMPTFLLHGSRDVLVPIEAAHETHRLVPQSELVELDDNHFMVFAGGERLWRPIAEFVARVEAGTATSRAQAPADRLAAAAEPFNPRLVTKAEAVTLLVLMALLALSTLVSEDLACIAGGVLAAQGRVSLLAATFACGFGIFAGDLLLYLVGRTLGRPWLRRAPLRWWIKPESVERGTRWFAERGPMIAFISRFTPGTRLATYVAAGVLRAPFWPFTLALLLAVALWTPILVGLAAWLGQGALSLFEGFERYAWIGVVAIAVLVLVISRLVVPLFTWKGRRRLYGAWGRLTRWEFWPPWAFYPPVVLYLACLALRHRSATLFTAANPAMPASGFIGESKGEILDGLGPEWVARYRRLPAGASPEEKLAAARAFLAEHGLDLPLVVKPDAGQRGLGVVVARSWEEVHTTLATASGDLVVQEHVEGLEFGVFYLRQPGEETGTIFSITEKQLPSVVGDGERTLEELILADRRAVFAARSYFERFAGRLDEVPAAGEAVRLTDLGTHCRGAVFLDGAAHHTPELAAAIERISRSYEGFFFGRYDLRVPSVDDLRAGRGLRVLELNGVTSEATHIYDPRHSLFAAYRVLFRQWSAAYQIGRRNREAGHAVEGPLGLLRRWWAFQRARRR